MTEHGEAAGFSILPYASEHRDAVNAALVDAFTEDPLFEFVIPRADERVRWLPHLVDELIHQAAASGWTRIAVNHAGEPVGACLAGPYPPSAWQNFRMNLRLTVLPKPWEPAVGPLLRTGDYQKVWKQMHFGGPHIFVYMIGVARAYHRRGLGGRLMRALMAQTDTAGLPIYLETQTESNVPFYAGLGFELTDEQRPFADGPRTWGFFRDVPAS